MKHIDAFFEYINHALNEHEKAYLIKLLDKEKQGGGSEKLPTVVLDHVSAKVASLVQSPDEARIQSEFTTLSKRSVKYSTIKKNLLIQKPKSLLKLQNFIKHIGQGDGGFSDTVINKIVENLTLDHVLKINESQNVQWLK